MFRLLDNTRISRYTLLYLLIIIIYTANASQFVRLYGDIHRFSEGSIFLLITTIIFIRRNHVVFPKHFLKIVGIFLIYAAITTINNRVINLIWIYKWILGLVIAFSLCQVYGKKIFVAYETILYRLCQISLVLWLALLFFKGPFISIMSQLSLTPFSTEKETLNILIYSVNNFDDSSYALLKRNAGFAWEPGAYSCFVILALFCNMLRTNFTFKKNRPLLTFILSILSTQSTTGFFMLIFLFAGWLIAQKKVAVAWVIIPLLGLLFSFPFVQDKFYDHIDSNQEFEFSDLSIRDNNDVNRLIAFQISWEEFKRHPLIGLGGYDDGTYLRQKGYEVVISSGIGKILAMYGLIMTFLFLYTLRNTTKIIEEQFQTRNAYLLYIPIIGMMFSYNLWLLPFYITFWMYGFLISKMQEINEKS